MTDRTWPENISPAALADRSANRIEREHGIDDPHDLDARGVVRGFLVSLVLPLTGFGIVLVILMWLVIAKFNLLTF